MLALVVVKRLYLNPVPLNIDPELHDGKFYKKDHSDWLIRFEDTDKEGLLLLRHKTKTT